MNSTMAYTPCLTQISLNKRLHLETRQEREAPHLPRISEAKYSSPLFRHVVIVVDHSRIASSNFLPAFRWTSGTEMYYFEVQD